MDARSPSKRFLDSFAEEMGRWSARVIIFLATLLVGQVFPLWLGH